MMMFFQPDWAGACWGRWAGPGLMLWTGLKALDRRAGDRTAAVDGLQAPGVVLLACNF